MRNVTTFNLTVRSYEVGHDVSVLNGSFMNYLEELTIQASNRAGYNEAWFEEKGYLWLVRKWMLRFLEPATLGDNLQLETWISDFRRVQSHREYKILRGEDLLVRARANWVFIDRNSLRPTRMLPEFANTYGPIPDEPLEVLIDEPTELSPLDVAPYQAQYTVRYNEIDRARHLNNTHYIRWIENNLAYSLVRYGVAFTDLRVDYHEFEYQSSAQFGDTVTVTSTILGHQNQKLWWQHQLNHAETNQSIAVGRSCIALSPTVLDNILQH